jgi:threonine dehydrogenase-like Zn-dependent dehydrogenase
MGAPLAHFGAGSARTTTGKSATKFMKQQTASTGRKAVMKHSSKTKEKSQMIKVGDRVSVYHHIEWEVGALTLDGWKAEVIGLKSNHCDDASLLLVRGIHGDVDGVHHEYIVHPKQCRKLKPKTA